MNPEPPPGPAPPALPVLLVEESLGRLATWLRLLGYDAPLLKRPPALVPPGAWLLSRRRALAGRPGVVFILSSRLEEQLPQVLAHLGGPPPADLMFSRCARCNLAVRPVPRQEVAGVVADHTLALAEGFTRCPGCGRVYWPGSHGQRARARLAAWLAQAGQGQPPAGA